MGRKEMAESCGWIFVDFIPLLYDKKRLARQFQIETWLNLSEVAKELGLERIEENKLTAHPPTGYIV
jgi:hypothetical protein